MHRTNTFSAVKRNIYLRNLPAYMCAVLLSFPFITARSRDKVAIFFGPLVEKSAKRSTTFAKPLIFVRGIRPRRAYPSRLKDGFIKNIYVYVYKILPCVSLSLVKRREGHATKGPFFRVTPSQHCCAIYMQSNAFYTPYVSRALLINHSPIIPSAGRTG